MTHREYADLIAGQLSPADLERLTSTYGSDTINSILRGETHLRDVLTSISDRQTSTELPPITLDETGTKPLAEILSRRIGWVIVLSGIVVMAGLAAVLPSIVGAVAETRFDFTDPLPMTILVILLIGLGAMFLVERSDDL